MDFSATLDIDELDARFYNESYNPKLHWSFSDGELRTTGRIEAGHEYNSCDKYAVFHALTIHCILIFFVQKSDG